MAETLKTEYETVRFGVGRETPDHKRIFWVPVVDRSQIGEIIPWQGHWELLCDEDHGYTAAELRDIADFIDQLNGGHT
jgi:hypothetical protein